MKRKSSQKRQLKESFFNPNLPILPIFVFLIIDHFVIHRVFEGDVVRKFAWYGALATALILTIYVGFTYRRLFKWYLFFMLSLFGVATIMSYANVYFTTGRFAPLLDETVFLLAVFSVFVFQKQVLKLTNRLVSPLVPMTNNIVEFYKYLKILAVIVATYIAFFLIFSYFKHYYIYQQVLNYVFSFALLALVVFSYLKTRFVHFHLTDDRWLPVVTHKGEVVEKMKRLSSLSDQRLYTHPVVRGILIKEGRILVQKSAGKDIFYDKPLWDNMIDNHIGIGEKDKTCLKKTALKSFGIEIKKSFCLTEYIHTTPYEHQYEFVFLILDYSGEIKPNPKKIAEIKWMSPAEIESELDSGIFDERFVKEYGLLKRAGLLMTEE